MTEQISPERFHMLWYKCKAPLDTPLTLDNLFKYAVPAAEQAYGEVVLGMILQNWVFDVIDADGDINESALALFLGLEKALEDKP